ncbi:MAG: PAS domain S-box protein [Geothrix sp.]|nr:PAS domain S-box protein [Geothrix sp.]
MTDRHLRRQVVFQMILWTLGMAAFVALGAYYSYRESRENALSRARENFQKDVMVRMLVNRPGGGYALPDEPSRSNPHGLHLPNSAGRATGDMPFAMGNSAPMTQFMHELGIPVPELRGHIASLRPLSPENAGDAWEQKALHKLESGPREYWDVSSLDGHPRLRFMGALVTLEGCLRCHAAQGYKVGDIRGGISFTVPLNQDSFLTSGIHNVATTLGLGVLWALGLVAILLHGRSNLNRLKERRLAETALRESEEQLRTIFDASEAGIILVSPEGTIRYANHRMAEMFGTTLEGLIGTHYTGHIHASEKQAGSERLHRILYGGLNTVSSERRYIRADGTDFWGHFSGKRLNNEDGSLNALVGVITDITERKKSEEENARLQAQLQQVQHLENLGNLAGGVAHDMNNVLGAILGLASANLNAIPANSPSQRTLGTIIKAAERGAQMMKSLLNLARKSPAEERELNLNELVHENVQLLEPSTLSKVRLVMDLDQDLHRMRGDGNALGNAFVNLCVNSVDAMAGAGTLLVRTRNVGADWVEVEVEDSGCGMTEEVLEKAVVPFFTTKEPGKGTGLGLSMVYSTVKAHHGQMELESQPGLKTIVRMRFPAFLPGTAAVGTGPSGSASRSLCVLLVDDDDLVRTTTETLLEAVGHQVVAARSGEAALAKLASGARPDLVILDLNMPGLGGTGTLPRLRALCPALPVLLATGRADQTALDLVSAYPHVTLLAKPFGLEELKQHIQAISASPSPVPWDARA